jgi:hypothetical protein
MADLCEVLTKVRSDVLTNAETWTQGAYARNAEGTHCSLENGVRFCFAGAMQKAMDDLKLPPYVTGSLMAKLNMRMISKYNASIITFNDYALSFEDVASAIETIKEEVCSQSK